MGDTLNKYIVACLNNLLEQLKLDTVKPQEVNTFHFSTNQTGNKRKETVCFIVCKKRTIWIVFKNNKITTDGWIYTNQGDC